MARVGGIGSPFRPPCGGWASPPRVWLPTKWSHYRSEDSAILRYQNTTTVPNPMCGNNYGATGQTSCGGEGCPSTVPPFRIPNNCVDVSCSSAPTTCDGSFNPPASPPCDSSPDGPDITNLTGEPSRLANTFAAYNPPQYVNRAVCKKTGFKNVFAWKMWHGHVPWNDNNCGCTGTPPELPPPVNTTLYLSLAWDFSISEYVPPGDEVGDPPGTNTFQLSGTSSIGRYTGNNTVTGFYYEELGDGTHPAIDGSLGTFVTSGLHYCAGSWVGTNITTTSIANDINAGNLDGTTNTSGYDISASVTDTVLTVTISSTNSPGGDEPYQTETCTLTLSNPYTSDDVNADCNTLLGYWDLSDDAQYPFRSDADCTRGPIINYDETGPSSPGIYGFTYLNGTSYNQTVGTATGAVIGGPTPAGYDAYWDSTHATYTLEENEEGAFIPNITYYGAYSPCYCPQASQWTDDGDAFIYYPGAWAKFQNGVLTKAKWAEVIVQTFPSHNFARPRGLRDSLLLDQTTVNCGPASDCSTSPYTNEFGNLLFPGCDASTPGPTDPDYAWWDNQTKGNWCLLTWTNDFRGSPSSPTSVTMTQHCSQFQPCCPAVVYITPQDGSQPAGETDASFNSQSFPHPNLGLDSCYGSLWQSIPKQVMTDPLWQTPVVPCDRRDNGCTTLCAWSEDDGSGLPDGDPDSPPCNYFYPQRPWEECLASVPLGAPALPGGYSLTRSSGADPGTNPPQPLGVLGGAVDAAIWATPNAWMPAWVWSNNRLANIAAGGRFSCEYADPLAVCGDDSEDTDL